MNSFLKGFVSLFNWMDSFHNSSPQERLDQILDDFYSDYPWIERDDKKALENDFKALYANTNNSNYI